MRWSDIVNAIAQSHDTRQAILDKCVTEGAAPQDPRYYLIAAALRRSEALLQGFFNLLDAGNRFAAVPLIRMQFDSAMRVHACSLIANKFNLVSHMLSGKPLKNFREAQKDALSDCNLHESLTKKYPFVSASYKVLSGFVHLSDMHLCGIFDQRSASNEKRLVCTDHYDLPPWSDEHRKDDAVVMWWATHVLTEECKLLMA